ncbi:hypothetical protein B0J12DRAFT_22927 [Macrophomina phaseolina]|uniref:Uncharacterized protein n=1 Tax=Macrophomina phaseolina TaxID=35725 RepID=A0ABQ8GXV4_9PEZI|nr:hypothetical protein B0J12DRAFT_22927 [Macrophomina phaseolina]
MFVVGRPKFVLAVDFCRRCRLVPVKMSVLLVAGTAAATFSMHDELLSVSDKFETGRVGQANRKVGSPAAMVDFKTGSLCDHAQYGLERLRNCLFWWYCSK